MSIPPSARGCVKITPGHDFNDYEVGRRHDLPLINVFTADAPLNDEAPAAYRGLDRFEARKRVVADLETAGPAREDRAAQAAPCRAATAAARCSSPGSPTSGT